PAIAAGVAALGDQPWAQAAVEHNEMWRGKLAEAFFGIGLGVTPSAANFLLLHFGAANGKSAVAADKFLHERRIILRRVEEYGLPGALRMTVGTEDENRAALDALTAFMRGNSARQ
ncbi:MAG: aminotransferase class I/II-fold pyridoxal phosphate-dependent enzyme, partial [Methyloceanibacter sp.]